MQIIDILLAILIVAAIVLCVYLIITLRRINKTLDLVQSDVHTIVNNSLPLIGNLTEVSEKALEVTSITRQHVSEINNAYQNLKSKFSGKKIGRIDGKPENRISRLIRNLRAISKGIAAFVSKISE